MTNKRAPVFLFALLAGLIILVTPAGAEPAAVTSGGPQWQTPVEITTTSNGGKLPAIDVGSDGRTVLIAYLRQMSGNASDTAPYARKSTNNGATWASPVAIAPDGPAEITFVDVAIDNNVAHAVWTDQLDGSLDIFNIYYARENNWGASPAPFSTVQEPQTIATPAIAARGNRVFIAWAEEPPPEPPEPPVGFSRIYYRFSTNGGASWSANNLVYAVDMPSLKPDMAIGADGRVHLVWQQGATHPFPQFIMYSQGTVSGNSVNWTPPIPISDASGTQRAWTPQILLDGSIVQVSFTDQVNNDSSQEYVHHLRCASGCATIANWQSTSNPVSGAALEENSNDPLTVKSTLARLGGCTYVYFHGVPPGAINDQIFGVNSCRNWSAGGRDEVTPANEAAISPQMVAQNNWFLYMTYEKKGDSGGRTVWFVRNDPALYLPVIRKP